MTRFGKCPFFHPAFPPTPMGVSHALDKDVSIQGRPLLACSRRPKSAMGNAVLRRSHDNSGAPNPLGLRDAVLFEVKSLISYVGSLSRTKDFAAEGDTKQSFAMPALTNAVQVELVVALQQTFHLLQQ